jgi:hypothetical protein
VYDFNWKEYKGNCQGTLSEYQNYQNLQGSYSGKNEDEVEHSNNPLRHKKSAGESSSSPPFLVLNLS